MPAKPSDKDYIVLIDRTGIAVYRNKGIQVSAIGRYGRNGCWCINGMYGVGCYRINRIHYSDFKFCELLKEVLYDIGLLKDNGKRKKKLYLSEDQWSNIKRIMDDIEKAKAL